MDNRKDLTEKDIQEAIRKGDEDLAAGRYKTYNTREEFLADFGLKVCPTCNGILCPTCGGDGAIRIEKKDK